MSAPSVCLFFTMGMSLEEWERTGLLEREVRPYQELARRGGRVAFVTYGGERDREIGAGIEGILVLPYYSSSARRGKLRFLIASLCAPLRFRRVLAGFSVFKSNQIMGSWSAVIAGWLLRKPSVVRCGYEHYEFAVRLDKAWWKRAGIYLLSWASYRSCTAIVQTTEQAKLFVTQRFSVPQAKIVVIPNYVDTELFDNRSSERKLQRILAVGRLSAQKNLPGLIYACRGAGVGLDLIGEGELREELEELVRMTGADVRFLGRVSNRDLPPLLNRYAVFALVSHFEGHPKTLLEAMSCGAAVIASTAPGVQEVVQHGETGWLVATDAVSISAGIQALFADESLRASLGKAARAYCVEHFGLERVLGMEWALFARIVRGGRI